LDLANKLQQVLNAPTQTVETSKEILRSLLLVHLPPTLYELAVIADLPKEVRNSEEAISALIQHCGAFTQIFEDNGKLKVQLSYSSVRDYLKSKADDWLSMPSQQIQHGLISLRCFDYVRAAVKKAATLNQVVEKEEVEKDDDDEKTKDQAETKKTTEPETDTHVVLKVDDTQSKTADPELMPLGYPHTEWIEHALEATPDIVDSFDLGEMFWLLDSEERAEWSRSYSTLNEEEDFDVKFTALHIAAYFGYVPLADVLLRNEAHTSELGMSDSNGHQPLYWASVRGHMNMVQKLVDEGADVNGYEDNVEGGIVGLAPLHGAASSGSVEIAEYLLHKGASINVANETSGTALYAAAEAESIPMVQLLLDQGADPNAIWGGELVPLNIAALSGNLEIVQILVAKGAALDPEVEYTWGSALGVAAYYGSTEVVKFLLESGARFDVEDSDGDRPLALAANEEYAEILKILLGYERDPEEHQLIA
jgi:ankyrin repeat protein